MFNLAQCWERMEPQELEWSYVEGFENWETPSIQPHFLVAKATSSSSNEAFIISLHKYE